FRELNAAVASLTGHSNDTRYRQPPRSLLCHLNREYTSFQDLRIMAEFDPAKTPYSLSPVLVEAANQAVGQLRARKISSIVIKEPPTGYRLSNLVRMYTQAYIRRCLRSEERRVGKEWEARWWR